MTSNGENIPPSGGRFARFQFGRRTLRRLLPLVALAMAILAGIWLYDHFFPPAPGLSEDDVDQIVVRAMASATPAPALSAQAYQTILPSLVLIQTGRDGDGEDGQSFGVGTGVVVNDAGDILTAYHVVSDASTIEIGFADGTRTTAEITLTEPENDIAVLHPLSSPELIVPAILGNPRAMRIGDQTFAVGNPLGLSGSMSAGVISGFDRTLPLPDDEGRLEGLIQFDAAVNPGNSGGPLLNKDGHVVGIVTALANPTEQNYFIGIGFAVPIETAVSVAGAPRQ